MSTSDKSGAPRANGRLWLAGVLGLASLLVGGVIVRTMLLTARSTGIAARLDESLTAYDTRLAGQRWTPKPLRGASHPGNIYAEQVEASRGLAMPEGLFGPKGDACAKPTDAQARFLEEHREGFAQLRAAASAEFSLVPHDLLGGVDAPMPPVGALLGSQRALLTMAALSSPKDCAEIAADAIRLAQAVSPGGGLLGLTMSAVQVERGAQAMAACLRRGDGPMREAASRELAQLISDYPTMGAGTALESEYLGRVVVARNSARFDFLLPTTSEQRETFWIGGDLLDYAAWSLDHVEEARSIGSLGYPEAAKQWSTLRDREQREDNLFLTMTMGVSDEWIQSEQRALAVLGGVATLAQLLTNPESELVASHGDPFTRAALTVARSDDGTLQIGSVGPDGASQGGTGDDVVVAERSSCP